MKKIKAGIIGITGYTGEELLKIFVKHTSAELSFLAGRLTQSSKSISEFYPKLPLKLDVTNLDIDSNLKDSELKNTDVVFLALPHGVSIDLGAKLVNAGKKVIDLSADYRIKDPAVYEKWYAIKHTQVKLLSSTVYGLPELYKTQIQKCNMVANPGCYPTSMLLGTAPLLKNALVETEGIIIDSKSGYSGAGREFSKKYESTGKPDTFAYKTGGKHRHIPEVEQEMTKIAGKSCNILFTPQVVPQERGMFTNIYLKLKKKMNLTDVFELYAGFYKNEPFVRILPENTEPKTINVMNTNYCDIGFALYPEHNTLLVMSALDNLLKGASGQAVQNMNIMFGLKETEGLL